jgi:hypothetical protein
MKNRNITFTNQTKGTVPMNTQANATKLLATPRAMALAISVILASSGPLCAQRALHAAAALPPFDRIYQQSLGAMQNEERAVGLGIDTDMDVLVESRSHLLLATIDGFEDIVLDDTGLNEFDWGFANVAGIRALPDDYYRLHIVVDLNRPEEAVGSFINSRGEAFDSPLQVMEDPDPDRGPRKGLNIEGPFAVETTVSLNSQVATVSIRSVHIMPRAP